MWLLSLFQRKRVPNCVVPRVWFVGEAVGPWASLGRALSAPTVLVCLTDRCQAHGCHHDLSDRCSNSAKVILSFAKALTLIFRRKKNVSACLLLKASVVHLWEMPSTAEVWELPTVRALQGTTEHPSASTHCLFSSEQKLHSPDLSLHQCLFSTIERLSEHSRIQYSPYFRIFPLDQELAYSHLWAKSRPVACFSKQSFIGKQPHSFVHLLSMTSLCVLQLSSCDRTYDLQSLKYLLSGPFTEAIFWVICWVMNFVSCLGWDTH